MLRRKLRVSAALTVGVLVAAGGTAFAVVGGEEGPTYRTVAASRGDVEQTLTLTGRVDAARRADLSFGTEGTVASVRVAQGDTVRTGQVIATLEVAALDAAVTSAKAALANAKAQLESDQEAQTASVQEAVTPTSGEESVDGPNPETAALLARLEAQQRAVRSAQSAATVALDDARSALSAQTAACATAYGSATAEPDEGSTSNEQVEVGQNDACDAALDVVQGAQQVVEDAQGALADALAELGTTLSSALGTLARTAAADVPADGASTPAPESGTPVGTTVTAAQLAADQAAIDQAEADLVGARAARSQAVLRATRSGTVASLDLAIGDRVAAGTEVAVVVGGTDVILSAAVAETSVDQVRVGQVARVTIPGSSSSTTGTVTAIGLTADTAAGSTTYPVTVTVEDPEIALPTGSQALVAIVLETAEGVVTLPISAVSRDGDEALVRTWDGTTLSRTPVTLGAVGTRTVAVTSGIDEGDEVVLADVDQAISGAASELDRRATFGPPGGGTVTFGRPG